ncbi:AroB-related putative sugar phosphate phospholyase (cyclizing) [Aliiglaciecola aliphaticivorans]
MFKDFSVQSFKGEYRVEFIEYTKGLSETIKDGDVVVADSNVLKLYPEIRKLASNLNIVEIQANEQAKTYENIGLIMERIISFGFSKNNRIIAIGGGVVQDICSFSSSVMFRGIEWIFIPTNLLTQCDSCIGSKTSVNLGNFKNQLGGFHPPKHIYIDFSFIDTLGHQEVSSGLGEMMHYFLTEKDADLSAIKKDINAAYEDRDVLGKLIQNSLLIKRKMVEIDEFDQGPRNIFNYGHTFGHAIESCSNYEVPHGVAVAYGIDLANLISVNKGIIDMSLRNEIREILSVIYAGTPLPTIDIDSYFDALSRDKKNIGSEMKVILTKGLGNMFKTTLENTPEIKHYIQTFFDSKLYEKTL